MCDDLGKTIIEREYLCLLRYYNKWHNIIVTKIYATPQLDLKQCIGIPLYMKISSERDYSGVKFVVVGADQYIDLLKAREEQQTRF